MLDLLYPTQEAVWIVAMVPAAYVVLRGPQAEFPALSQTIILNTSDTSYT